MLTKAQQRGILHSKVRNTQQNGGVYMTDCVRLNKIIKDSDYPIGVIASKSGMTTQSLHKKRKGSREFTIREMLALCRVLNIDYETREEIFLQE